MIDRATVAKIAAFAIEKYGEQVDDLTMPIEVAVPMAVLATVDEFTPVEPTADEVEAEIDRINAMYLAQTARQAVVHWLREQWARERIAWRKHLEANIR